LSNALLSYIFEKNTLLFRSIIFIAAVAALVACGRKTRPANFTADSLAVRKFIRTGDSLYATKSSYTTFLKSMECYDSALQVAEQSYNTALIAVAVFAKGRAYDAINNNPQKTIDYYKEAARLYASLPDKYTEALYIKHLVAHSYDKVNDSIHCVTVLQELYNEILPKPDSLKQQMKFTAEMALVSTEVRNYKLAEDILTGLTSRAWIKNDSTEYDYLDHYYLTKARIAVFRDSDTKTLYLDSVEYIFSKCRSLSDSMYYSSQLWDLFKKTGNSERENYYLRINNTIFNKFNTPQSVREANEKLSRMETAAVEKERKIEQEQGELRKKYIYLLAGLLLVISVLTLFLVKRNKEIRRKRNEALVTSRELLQKNLQNELLNKELHHRVKNNLQMILSLVYMQEKKTQADEAKANLQDIRLRIENIAAMHQQLLEQNNNVVDLQQYVMKLVSSVASLVGNGYQVITHLDIDGIKISTKQSFPLGLLLNELVTNTIKYAAPADKTLAVYVTIKSIDSTVTMQYRDSGRPVQKEQIKAGLGMNIISLLVAQLNGELRRDENNYFTYEITFPLDGE
jgi:two-component sensor histidine kinase